MSELKNINTESSFENRTGLIVWLTSKRNVKRLMNFGILHYVSSKLDYAILYVDSKEMESTIQKLENENYVKTVEESHLRDLPISYDDVLTTMQSEIDEKKRKEELETFSKGVRFDEFGY